MRVTQSIAYRNFLSDLNGLNDSSTRMLRELSSGRKINTLRDSPSGVSQLLAVSEQESKIDLYSSNTDDSSYFLKVADSALNEVQNLLTSIYTKGSQAATETISPEAREIIATEIRSLRDQMLTLANSQARGRYIFAGSSVSEIPFAASGDTVTYNGDDYLNRVAVDDNSEVDQGVSGSEAFDPIFTAMEDIRTALTQVTSTFSGLGLVRGKIGSSLSMLENVQSNLDSKTLSLTEQKSKISDADIADAAVRLNQVQTTMDAAMSAGATLLGKKNLFDIIG
jgi:flagellar hook-associated protein 3 FlgL